MSIFCTQKKQVLVVKVQFTFLELAIAGGEVERKEAEEGGEENNYSDQLMLKVHYKAKLKQNLSQGGVFSIFKDRKRVEPFGTPYQYRLEA